MKLQSKQIEGKQEHRIYDEAKTPLQRVLLSGILPEQQRQKWQRTASSLDPLKLVQHVETLQRAVWRCAEGGSGKTLVRFSLNACVSAAACSSQREALPVPAQMAPDLAETRDWSRSMNDPFLGEWEHIYAYVRARPMASEREILREWQQRFPERFVEAHLSLLQRRLREMRASLVVSQAEPGGDQRDSTTASELPSAQEETPPLADASSVMVPDPAPTLSFLPSTPEKELPPIPASQASDVKASLNKGSEEDQHISFAPEASAVDHGDALLASAITIDHAKRGI